MNKKKISIVGLLLDMTGSMSPQATSTIDAVNEYILGLKNGIKGDSRFVLAVFNSDTPFKILIDDDINKAGSLTHSNYTPMSTTPLYDAMGKMSNHIGQLYKDYKGEYNEVRVIFVTLTDGYENASVEFSLDSIRAMIEKRKKKNWEVVFLGANMDSFAAGGAMSIQRGSTMNFDTRMIQATLTNLTLETVIATNAEDYTAGNFFASTD